MCPVDKHGRTSTLRVHTDVRTTNVVSNATLGEKGLIVHSQSVTFNYDRGGLKVGSLQRVNIVQSQNVVIMTGAKQNLLVYHHLQRGVEIPLSSH